jgi:hypothetical protein
MTISSQSSILKKLSYTDEIKNEIINSGGTILLIKDNVLIASEVSESQYLELLKNPNIIKMDVLPLKRYVDEGIKYIEGNIT